MTAKVVLFDMDGTLIDSIGDIHAALNDMLTVHGFDNISLAESACFVGKGARVLIEKSLRHMGFANVPGEVIEDMYVHYVEMLERNGPRHTTLFPTVFESLVRLREAGLTLGVATNKARRPTLSVLEKWKVAGLFSVVLTSEEVPAPKPAPDLLLEAARRLGVAPASCAMVGDSMNDALAALAAGCEPLLVKTGYNEGVPVETWAAEQPTRPRVFDKMADVADYILGKKP